jgi:hypothetical protein
MNESNHVAEKIITLLHKIFLAQFLGFTFDFFYVILQFNQKNRTNNVFYTT